MVRVFHRAVEAVDRGETVAVATIVRAPEGGPFAVGERIFFDSEGLRDGTTGDALLDAEIARAASQSIATGRVERVRWPLSGSAETEIYVEPYGPPPSIVVCGAGHIAVPLAAMAKIAGFRVTVIDDRVAYANAARFPTADSVLAEPFEEALAATRVTRSTAIVLVTRGHRYDWDCLRVVAGSSAFYIGMIGSRRRVRAALLGLEREGIEPERLARISAPIGLDVGAETPEEIAVAILAEVVLARRGGTGRPLSALARREEAASGD